MAFQRLICSALFLEPIIAQSAELMIDEKFPLRHLSSAWSCVEEKKSSLPHPLTDMIDLHQEIISPADGPRSHFYPVSSTYTRLCFKRFGARGILLGFDRLMRENGELWLYPVIEIDGYGVKCDLPPGKSPSI